MPVCKWCQSNNNFQCLYEDLMSAQLCEVHPQTDEARWMRESTQRVCTCGDDATWEVLTLLGESKGERCEPCARKMMRTESVKMRLLRTTR